MNIQEDIIMAEITRDVKVGLKEGLEPRKTAELVQLVCRFRTEKITIDHNDKSINPKSLMSAMYLAAPTGTVFHVKVEGPEAEAAFDAIERFLA